MKKTLKSLIITAMIVAFAVPILSLTTAAPASATLDLGTGYVNTTALGLGDTDPRTIVVKIIQLALSCLGIIAVVIILIGGFKWMTAAGNEEQVEEAKKILVAGVIGLVIIIAAWGLAVFVINQMLTATGSTTTGIS
jgi:hypothetical protein